MTRFDTVVIGLPALLGGTLIAFCARRAIGNISSRGLSQSYRAMHSQLKRRMIDGNLLRFPGISLEDSMKPWVVGEVAGLLVLVSLVSLDRTARGIAGAAGIALLAAGVSAWMSLRSTSREALRSVERDLPLACFLLSLLLESGMGASPALQETAAAIPRGPLARELDGLFRARSLGLSRAESLERSMRRVPLDDYRLFLNHIRQGERLGIGLSGSLRGISEKMLASRDHRAETIAQQAAVKLLLPLVCFISPAVFLIILSPVILSLWGQMQGASP